MFDKLISSKKIRIGILGQGYVGLPLAVEFAKKGLSVTGFEVDPKKVQQLNKGISHIQDIPSTTLQSILRLGTYQATADFKKLSNMDVVIICVPTPLRKTKDPDLSYVVNATQLTGQYLRRNQLIILESTTYPGTTREILLPLFSKKGFQVGKDFFLAFSPERVDPGNKKYGIHNTPKVVGGMTPKCTKYAVAVYSAIVDKVLPVSSPESAEMVKLLENTFRAVNIGLVNEVAIMCDKLKINVWEVIDSAATKPFGFMPFYPGPGIGGHCIPLDPHYLSWKLKTLNFYARFIELAGDINSHMPEYVVRKTTDALNDRQKSIKGSRILVLGVAYKRDIGDVRESPALDVIELLKSKGALVNYHDPYVKDLTILNHTLRSVPLTSNVLRKQDCVILITDHTSFNMADVARQAQLVIDTRNAARKVSRRTNIITI
ncbi:MAG TPA: nucleotide sugar dehydrogenase [Elusimicrobiota bacterium]|nr:nucleotide sugar dehydrogenase [Elusimicrobiota bacterium]